MDAWSSRTKLGSATFTMVVSRLMTRAAVQRAASARPRRATRRAWGSDFAFFIRELLIRGQVFLCGIARMSRATCRGSSICT